MIRYEEVSSSLAQKIISLLMIIPLLCSYGGGLVAKLDQLLQPHGL